VELPLCCGSGRIQTHNKARLPATPTGSSPYGRPTSPFKKQADSKREGLPRKGGIQYNDVSVMAYAIDPSVFECNDLNITLETQGAFTRRPAVANFP